MPDRDPPTASTHIDLPYSSTPSRTMHHRSSRGGGFAGGRSLHEKKNEKKRNKHPQIERPSGKEEKRKAAIANPYMRICPISVEFWISGFLD